MSKTSTKHRPPGWLAPEARGHWAHVAAQLWRARKPTPLERIAGAVYAEELALSQDTSARDEVRRFAAQRALSLETALKLEPVLRARYEQSRRTA